MTDQATRLRRLIRHEPPATGLAAMQGARPWSERPLARAVAVTSGKGGVGKSNVAVNLAVALSRLGQRVCLLDADLGLANADVLCGLSPRLTLDHVVRGRCRLADAMLLAPGGFRLIPGACGVAALAELSAPDRRALLEQLAALEQVVDTMIIDTSAGLSRNVLAFAGAAQRVIVVTTPEPTAVTDGYGMIKALASEAPDAEVELVVNMASGPEEARDVFSRIDRVSRAFLSRAIRFGGSVPLDPAVREAVRRRLPFCLASPDAPATLALGALARAVAGLPPRRQGRGGFLRRLVDRLGRSENHRVSGGW